MEKEAAVSRAFPGGQVRTLHRCVSGAGRGGEADDGAVTAWGSGEYSWQTACMGVPVSAR